MAGGVNLEVSGNLELLVRVGERGSRLLALEVIPDVIDSVEGRA